MLEKLVALLNTRVKMLKTFHMTKNENEKKKNNLQKKFLIN